MSRGRILIADDKPTYLALFRRIVPVDLEIACVSDGAEAMARLGAESFDVLVSDVRMPGADGLTVLEKVREARIDVEVVLMTAYAAIPDAVRAMKLGADDYLTKPFTPDVAIAAIERALQRRAARRGVTPEASTAETGKSVTEMTYREVLATGRDRLTREYLTALLREFHGTVTLAAERAGIERESFHRLLKRHGIRAEDFRPR